MSLTNPPKPTVIRTRERSKGCGTCRVRKVKCDRKFPVCSQCEKKGRPCSGPVGNVFLDVRTRDSGKLSSIEKRRAKPSEGGNGDGDSKGKTPHREASSSKVLDLVRGVDASNLRLPSWYQPSKSVAFEQFFVSHFVKDYVAGEARRPSDNNWMMQLPELISSNTDVGLRSAINAVSVVFYGKLSHNKAVEVEGYRWYALGLEVQRKRLQRDCSDVEVIPSAEAICASLMMSFYETVINTSREGWARYICGAAKMLEMRGPERCQTGLAFQMFRAVRLGMAYLATAKEKPLFFATKRWLTIPFSGQSKTAFDSIIDILTIIPVYLEKANVIKAERVPISNVADTHRKLTSLGRELNDIWQQLLAAETLVDIPSPTGGGISASQNAKIEPERSNLVLKKPLLAEARFLYDSGELLIMSCLVSISPPETTREYKEHIVSHCASILTALDYLSLQRSETGKNITAPFRAIVPLKLVAQRTVDESQRRQAMSKLDQWTRINGLSRPDWTSSSVKHAS